MRPTLIELAVRVLRAAVQRANGERIDAHDVQLALRCLLPHAANRSLLTEFWIYAGQIHHANRADSCAAVLGSSVEDLRAAGRYPDVDQEQRRYAAELIEQVAQDREGKRQVHRRHYFAPPRRRAD